MPRGGGRQVPALFPPAAELHALPKEPSDVRQLHPLEGLRPTLRPLARPRRPGILPLERQRRWPSRLRGRSCRVMIWTTSSETPLANSLQFQGAPHRRPAQAPRPHVRRPPPSPNTRPSRRDRNVSLIALRSAPKATSEFESSGQSFPSLALRTRASKSGHHPMSDGARPAEIRVAQVEHRADVIKTRVRTNTNPESSCKMTRYVISFHVEPPTTIGAPRNR